MRRSERRRMYYASKIKMAIDLEGKVLKIRNVRPDISEKKIMDEVMKIAHASVKKNSTVVTQCLDELYEMACRGESLWWE